MERIPKDLKAQWALNLKKSGFTDIEDHNERLKQYDRRTISFENRDRILAFFLTLDKLMTNYKDMPAFERRIMSFYSNGMRTNEIVIKLRFSRTYVQSVLRRYTGLVIAIQQMEGRELFP